MGITVQSESPPTLYEQAFRKRLQALLPETPDWLQDLRLRALSRFEHLGFPTRRLEAWKYINVRPLLSQAFLPYECDVKLSAEAVAPYLLNDVQGVIQLVFVNGHYEATLSSKPSALPAGVVLGSLKSAIHDQPEQVEAQLAQRLENLLPEEPDAFVALNTALFEDGALISIPHDVNIAPLVQLLFVSLPDGHPRASYTRNLITLGQNARVNLAIEHVGLDTAGDGEYFNSSVQEFVLAEGAQAECSIIFNEREKGWHLSATRSQLADSAQLKLNTVTLTGQVTRHSITSLLQGEKAEVHLNGLDVLCDQTEVYHHTVTEHWVPHCVSTQYYKGILDDAAKSEFNGMVFVAAGADGTDSQQLNKNLLLSENARVWTRPQLQINADDVKCAHGATVGQLEKEQLFYLASRGLDFELAQGLLTYGFAEEIIQRIDSEPLRRYLDTRVLNNLHAASATLKQKMGSAL
jgi:Fe-S cluster assembly protein SufD